MKERMRVFGITLALVSGLTLVSDGQSRLRITPAEVVGDCSATPSSCPLVVEGDLEVIGAFRGPTTNPSGVSNFGRSGGLGISYGGGIAFNPATGGLFTTCEQITGDGGTPGSVAEFSIPTPVDTAILANLNTGTVLQNCADATEGNFATLNTAMGGYVKLGSLSVHGSKLIGTVFHQYDGSNEMRVSHFSHSTTLATSSFAGFVALYNNLMTGYVSWWMTPVPTPWQSPLGGEVLSGDCCLSVITRTSWGMSAFSFDPDDIVGTSPITIAGNPLMYYNTDHQTLGGYDTPPPITWNQTVQIGGMVIIPGSRTLLYFGMAGESLCYGPGTADLELVGTPAPPMGEYDYCYDPLSDAQGVHGYPYIYKMWAYDLNDLAAVKAGTMHYYEPTPYAQWEMDFPFGIPQAVAGGMTIDPATKKIYLSLGYADTTQGISAPVYYAIQVNNIP